MPRADGAEKAGGVAETRRPRARAARDRQKSFPPAHQPLPTSRAPERKRTNKMRRERLRRSRSAPSRDERATLRRSPGGAARARRTRPRPISFSAWSCFWLTRRRRTAPSRPSTGCTCAPSPRPGYPANAVLSWATSPASPAGKPRSGSWRRARFPSGASRPPPPTARSWTAPNASRSSPCRTPWRRASRAPEPRATPRTSRRAPWPARSQSVRGARGSVPTPPRRRARARALRLGARFGLRTRRRRTRALRDAGRLQLLGATRRRPPPSKAAFAGTRGVSVSVPRFARPAWESRDVFASLSRGPGRRTPSAESARRQARPPSSSIREVGGFDEKGLASVLAAATQLAPGRRVSPASDAEVGRPAVRRRGSTADLGVPRQNAAETSARRARSTRRSSACLPWCCARRAGVRVPDGFRARPRSGS